MAHSAYLLKTFPMILLILVIGCLFIFSLFLYLGCIGFWMKDANEFVLELILNAVVIATQPNAAYHGAFKMFTLSILPVAFLSLFPIEFFRTGLLKYLLITLSGTILFFGIVCRLFYCGLKRYESGKLVLYRQ